MKNLILISFILPLIFIAACSQDAPSENQIKAKDKASNGKQRSELFEGFRGLKWYELDDNIGSKGFLFMNESRGTGIPMYSKQNDKLSFGGVPLIQSINYMFFEVPNSNRTPLPYEFKAFGAISDITTFKDVLKVLEKELGKDYYKPNKNFAQWIVKGNSNKNNIVAKVTRDFSDANVRTTIIVVDDEGYKIEKENAESL